MNGNPYGTETHTPGIRALRCLTVPLFNVLPGSAVRRFLGLSPDGSRIMGCTGSALALEVMYAWHERSPFAPGIIAGCANLFWFHAISQPKAMRNRLRIVQRILRDEILLRLRASSRRILIMSLGGGSSRALIQALHEIPHRPSVQELVRVVNVDKDRQAAALGRELAAGHGLGEVFRWVEGNSKDLGSIAEDDSVDIVEMVGLFDYFSDKIGEMILRRIHRKLKPGGLLVVGNVCPHEEMPFVSKMGWPEMYYRHPDDLARLIAKGGFRMTSEIVTEPLGIHMIATARK